MIIIKHRTRSFFLKKESPVHTHRPTFIQLSASNPTIIEGDRSSLDSVPCISSDYHEKSCMQSVLHCPKSPPRTPASASPNFSTIHFFNNKKRLSSPNLPWHLCWSGLHFRDLFLFIPFLVHPRPGPNKHDHNSHSILVKRGDEPRRWNSHSERKGTQ